MKQRNPHQGTEHSDNDTMDERAERLRTWVASEDCFQTISCQLDSIYDIMEHPEIGQLVDDLLYLQDHYKIVTRRGDRTA